MSEVPPAAWERAGKVSGVPPAAWGRTQVRQQWVKFPRGHTNIVQKVMMECYLLTHIVKNV